MIFNKSDKRNQRKFDLNIETILENWDTFHAVREVIANALDEQILSKTKEIKIYKDEQNDWHIQDFGRGIKIEHFTQNENKEKLNTKGIIGKFGIGLKDALATFNRNGIDISITSKHGVFTTGKSSKHGFDDVVTLHMYLNKVKEKNFAGTDFILSNLSDEYMEQAKNCFLQFSGEKIIEENMYGMVLENTGKSNIYINGVNVANEENFLFSYNITNINFSIQKAMNRERTNIGRNAYSSTVKSLLLKSKKMEVASKLIDDFKNYSIGNMHDELQWIDIQEHAVKVINNLNNVVFVTNSEIESSPDLVEEIKSSGYSIINIPSMLKERISGQKDDSGIVIRDFNHFKSEYYNSFEFNYISRNMLTEYEKRNYDLIDEIIELIGYKRKRLPEIKISGKMQKDEFTFKDSEGLFINNTIILKRSILLNKKKLCSVLLHEIAHYSSKASDVSRDFETELTNFMGTLGEKLLKNSSSVDKNKNQKIKTSLVKINSLKNGILKSFRTKP